MSGLWVIEDTYQFAERQPELEVDQFATPDILDSPYLQPNNSNFLTPPPTILDA